MRSSSRRTTKLIGGALFAAAIAATSVATISTVSADVGDAGVTSEIRVQPVNAAPGSGTYAEDQNAAVIAAGASAQPASNVQLLIPSDWEAGDRITLQVQADGSLPPSLIPVHQSNCQNVAQTIAFAGTATVAVTGGPLLGGAGWSVGDCRFGLTWHVIAHRDPHCISAEALSQSSAWQAAADQASQLGEAP